MKHLDNLHDLLVRVMFVSDFSIKLFYSKEAIHIIKIINV